jgi:opacity protein-like surface antigen
MLRGIAMGLATAALVVMFPATAAADLTAFLGFSPTPHARPATGFAFGINLLIVGFEFEYSRTRERLDVGSAAPGLATTMVNGLVMTPTSRTQLYLTAGGGFFRERTGTETETSFGTNLGGGVKIGLAGPVRLRLDYRVYNLRGNPQFRTPQRFYAGLNLSF